jgi:serine protease
VTAKSATGAEATCSASALNYCTLGALASGVSYTLSLTAKNARGSETNIDEFQAQDADISLQWYLGTDHGIAATRAWTATRGAKSVVVAVLDSGIIDHPELSGQLVDGYDFISDVKFDGDTIPGRDSDPTDIGSPEGDWHGTHVAGIIAAKSDGDGISGIAPLVKIQPIRVLSDKGGSVLDVMDAMKWAAGMSVAGVPDNTTPAKIINLSLTADMACYSQLQAVVDEIRSRGVVIVAAAGNGDANNVPRDNRLTSPTGCEGPISVGSSNFGGDITSYSNYNSDLLAPGGDLKFSVAGTNGTRGAIYSLWNPATPFSDGKVGYAGTIGTSMAAPMVSGTLALMVSLRPLATVRQLEEAILVSVQPFSPGTFCSTRNDRYCGFGTLNAATALEALIAITG